MSRVRVLLAVLVSLLVAPAAAGGASAPADVFRVGAKPASAGWVTFGESLPDARALSSPMLRRIAGVSAELGLEELKLLRRSCRRARPDEVDGERVWVVHLVGDDATARAEVLRTTEGGWAARSLDEPELVARLDDRRLEGLLARWAMPLGGPPAEPRGELFEIPQPYHAGAITLTDGVMADRFYEGTRGRPPVSDVTRVLAEELAWARLPAGYDPARPAGVLLWISPSDTTRIPPHFFGVLDDLNIIACGFDNAGNNRRTRDGSEGGIVDRLQLQFDALQTVRARYSVDDARVYASGFSGGGRVSSILLGTFPEIFAGAVPIVGLDSFKPAFIDERRYVPARYPKPRGDRWKALLARRMFSLTGSEDFNLAEMRTRTNELEAAGLAVRLDITPGMPHEKMPPEGTVRTAMSWVDEPQAEAAAEGAARAGELWLAYREQFGPGEPASDEARQQLVEITRAGPWSEPAWSAAGLLGFQRPAP